MGHISVALRFPPPRRGMLPWPLWRWDGGEEQAPEEQGPSPFGDPGKAWNSGGEALGEPGTPPQDSPQSRSPRPSWTQREQLLALPPTGLVAQQSPGTPVPLSPQMAWEVASSRMTLLEPWDPNYEATAGPQLAWRPSCASGASFSGRTLCHPSFWPLYEAASGRDCRPLTSATVHENGEQAPRDAGFPVMCYEDVFLSDPLLPPGQRVPLYLSEAPQQVSTFLSWPHLSLHAGLGRRHFPLLSPQVMGSLKLLLPPPIMSHQVSPTRSPGCCTAWLSGPELIALTGLLQMSQGEPRPSSTGSLAASMPPSGPPDPVSGHPGPSGDPSCSHCTDPSFPWTPDTSCP
ncbi:PREDICTED: LOW QUALITY PROTEIN: histone deacetylase complex subunit SAP25 [Miniopterus natalensis]|uniref:LOW QUALITY PROTEIN: histone deacetylase complex subunit SAP25 n=1 Tax=Miniopterus natalensis TaxID=291302 RepID=UPI0007A72D35|nr:PREDICTED: LOW QUALITY PROTEIN: histone deacetylase complex subunit SAP25 [Miniopterus natalensis]